MAIPISYNLRNLMVRKTTTVMTALAAALSVLVLLAVLALVSGLGSCFRVTASPDQLIVLRSGAASETVSTITRQNFQDILSHSGIALDDDGRPLASLEIVTIVPVSFPDGSELNVTLRGMTLAGWKMRTQLHLIHGRFFRPGERGVIVDASLARKCRADRLGATLNFGEQQWTVVGIMDGGDSAFASEIFGDLNQVSSEYRRSDMLSSVILGAQPGQIDTLAQCLRADRRLNIEVDKQQEYYQRQMSAAGPVRFMGTFVAIVMALGGALAAMNTMYAAVARRSGEIGILRLMGFSRASVVASFLLESMIICLLGGALACLLALPLNGLETAIGSFSTWSEVSFHFRVTPSVLAAGMLFAGLIGALGGCLPALNASRRTLTGS